MFSIDEPLARLGADGTIRYYHADGLGSVIALSDENGVVKTLYNYSPFGITEMTGEASENPFKYTGREDDGTGLYYYRARYYSPEMGRFISEDPIRFAGGMNWYAYVENSPLNFVDPLGLWMSDGTPPMHTPDPGNVRSSPTSITPACQLPGWSPCPRQKSEKEKCRFECFWVIGSVVCGGTGLGTSAITSNPGIGLAANAGCRVQFHHICNLVCEDKDSSVCKSNIMR